MAGHEPSAVDLAAVVVAAGQGLRAGQPVPKQFTLWRGKAVLRHAVEAVMAGGVEQVVVAIPEGADGLVATILDGLANVRCVTGGATRQDSVRRALQNLAPSRPAKVLIHDAARPDCPAAVIQRLISALDTHRAAIPVLPVVDSLAVADQGLMSGSARREDLRRVQTPQAFLFDAILAAHEAWPGLPNAGDDAQVAQAAGIEVALVNGDERLKKLTVAEDFVNSTAPAAWPRTGTGYDVHRLVAGEDLWLCGVRIDHTHGLSGHSDADVAIHALVDAILGACAMGDIGQHFPPSDPQWRGASSAQFLEHAVALARSAGFAVGNVDVTIICEAPRIGPHRDSMRARLAQLLGTGIDAVSVKATTTERLGFAGRSEGIAAQAAATLVPLERH